MSNDDHDTTDDTSPLLTGPQREAQLWLLFDLLLTALVREVAKPEARAALLEVARQLLKDNEVSVDRSPDIRRGLALLAEKRGLPFKH